MDRNAAIEAYNAADAAYRANWPAYEAARVAYHARKIGDAEYMAARRQHDALIAACDAAAAAIPEGEE